MSDGSSGPEPIWPTPDPVSGWSPDVPLERPDWLADSEVGLSDEAVMTWHPVVTFWQLRRFLNAKPFPTGTGTTTTS